METKCRNNFTRQADVRSKSTVLEISFIVSEIPEEGSFWVVVNVLSSCLSRTFKFIMHIFTEPWFNMLLSRAVMCNRVYLWQIFVWKLEMGIVQFSDWFATDVSLVKLQKWQMCVGCQCLSGARFSILGPCFRWKRTQENCSKQLSLRLGLQ
jgi:hypothetical protein